jgi:Lar family restriction alleviation protein
MILIGDCPFCGCDFKDLTINSESVLGRINYWVQCDNCHAHGPRQSSESEAITQWKDRVWHNSLNSLCTISTSICCDRYLYWNVDLFIPLKAR